MPEGSNFRLFLKFFSLNSTCRTIPSPLEKIPHTYKLKHGAEITDDYFWLKDHDIDNPPLKEYISKENQYFDAYFKHTNAGKYCKQIEKEFIQLVESNTITDTAEFANGYYYHVKYVRGSDYPIYCRKREMKGKSQTILDVNEEAKGQSYISVKKPILSVDGELLAFAKSPTDDNYAVIHFLCHYTCSCAKIINRVLSGE